MPDLNSPLDLRDVVAELARRYPAGDTLDDPLALIVWENIGYLIDDERRRGLFEEFGARVGLTAEKIAGADSALLFDIARRGGMRPETRVERWRAIARIVLADCGGDLVGALESLPLGKARSLLKRFSAIGDPGADKILLFCNIAPRPCLESNGVRALARLGFFVEQRSYAASYGAAIGVIADQGLIERDWLIGAYLALRAHGRTLCRRSTPVCLACPLDDICVHGVVVKL